MGRFGYAMTEHDDRLWRVLEGAGNHLRMLGRLGVWSKHAERLHDRLGFYGLGLN